MGLTIRNVRKGRTLAQTATEALQTVIPNYSNIQFPAGTPVGFQGFCAGVDAPIVATLGDMNINADYSGTFYSRNDEIELSGPDSVVGKAVALTFNGEYNIFQQVACGVIELEDCRNIQINDYI